MKVLVIDDSKIIRDRIVSRLYEFSAISEILEAGSARGAYQIMESGVPDGIILDIRLPYENGIKVLKWIREHQILSQVIVFTNYPYPEYERKCREYGADYFLNKAADFEKVIEILSR